MNDSNKFSNIVGQRDVLSKKKLTCRGFRQLDAAGQTKTLQTSTPSIVHHHKKRNLLFNQAQDSYENTAFSVQATPCFSVQDQKECGFMTNMDDKPKKVWEFSGKGVVLKAL